MTSNLLKIGDLIQNCEGERQARLGFIACDARGNKVAISVRSALGLKGGVCSISDNQKVYVGERPRNYSSQSSTYNHTDLDPLHCESLLGFFYLTDEESINQEIVYEVQVGSFSDTNNALKLVGVEDSPEFEVITINDFVEFEREKEKYYGLIEIAPKFGNLPPSDTIVAGCLVANVEHKKALGLVVAQSIDRLYVVPIFDFLASMEFEPIGVNLHHASESLLEESVQNESYENESDDVLRFVESKLIQRTLTPKRNINSIMDYLCADC
jgi:hypothetical protein